MSAATPLLVKRAIFTFSKDRKLPGVLTVTGSQIQWTGHDPTKSQPHYVDIKAVSGPKLSRLVCIRHLRGHVCAMMHVWKRAPSAH